MTLRIQRQLVNVLAMLAVLLLLTGVLGLASWAERPLVHADPLRRVDAIVILGGGVLNAETPSPTTALRLLHGLRLFKKGYGRVIILTGGNPAEPKMPESEVMARVATDLGVPASSLVIEREASNTAAQAAGVAKLAKRQNLGSILLVTSSAHSYRAAWAFRKTGLEVVSSPATPPADLVGPRPSVRPHVVLVRIGDLAPVGYEYGAIAWYWWRGWL